MNEDRQQKPGCPSGPGYLEVMAITLMIAAAAVLGYHRYLAQKIYVLDLKGYLRTQKAMQMGGESSEEEWKASLDRVEQALNHAAADPTHVIVLKDLVLRNGEEIKIR